MRLYAITDRRLFSGDEHERTQLLLSQAARWAAAGVHYIQLREKDLGARELSALAGQLVELARVKAPGPLARSLVLINIGQPGAAQPDGEVAQIARQANVDGVHLPASTRRLERVKDIRATWREGRPVISVSCHTVEEARLAREAGASVIVFAPVFEKLLGADAPLKGSGLGALAAACHASSPVPVFALGGVTPENADACVEAGAEGVAGIHLFARDAWMRLVERRGGSSIPGE